MNLTEHLALGKAPQKEPSERWELLAETSPKDKPWDVHRALSDEVEEALSASQQRDFENQALRVSKCAQSLFFGLEADAEGVARLRLNNTFFCRVRSCSVCQWRRSLMWKARFFQALPAIREANPSGRWLFLTLTVKNCRVDDLRKQVSAMNEGFHRLVKRKEFADVLGWVRALEVTRGEDGSAHPHFHVLLFVRPSYFKAGHYVSAERWVEAWQSVMRLDYAPICDIRSVKAKKASIEEHGTDAALARAVAETLKYTVKTVEVMKDREWFLAMLRQLHRARAIASGGVLKNALKVEEESQQDLLLGDEEAEPKEEAPTLKFDWSGKNYRRKRSG